MKHIFPILLFLLMASACQTDESLESEFSEPVLSDGLYRHWKLTKMMTAMTGQITYEYEIPYTETIRFDADQTFVKTRIQDGTTTEVTGEFELTREEDILWIRLEYAEENGLIARCSSTTTEYLRLRTTSEIYGGAIACDGPHLFYSKISNP